MWILLYNPTSGGGKGLKESNRVKDLFESQGKEFIPISGNSYLDAKRKLAECLTLNKNQIKGVVVVGGDGMVHMEIGRAHV